MLDLLELPCSAADVSNACRANEARATVMLGGQSIDSGVLFLSCTEEACYFILLFAQEWHQCEI